mmetsp:Transcript_89963/g.226936  ORF Transcript_89963/g.226936 Transcript_89963/m.226936 type:complete len:134 (+) Transcript_89963:1385-1786(+)
MHQRSNHTQHVLSRAATSQTVHLKVVQSPITLRRVAMKTRAPQQCTSRSVECMPPEGGNGPRKKAAVHPMKKSCRIGDMLITGHEVSEGVDLLRDGVQRGGLETAGFQSASYIITPAKSEAKTFLTRSGQLTL